MDVWGHCAGCNRWFYCEKSSATPDDCPVCGATSARIEERTATWAPSQSGPVS